MTGFLRAASMVGAFLLLGYGLATTASQSSAIWLSLLAIVFGLLTFAFWPRLPRTSGQFQRSTVRVFVLFIVAFSLISVQLVRIQVVDSREISQTTAFRGDDAVVMDPRRRIEATEIERGDILTRDGEIVAETRELEDGSFDRVYPSPETGYVAGYYSPLLYGQSNLERAFDDYLMGRAGGNPVEQWLDGILHRRKRGYDVTLTLDSRLQAQADQLLGDRRGAVVLMDATSGAVLALVSKPNFDPNQLYLAPGSSDEAIAQAVAYWEAMNASDDAQLLMRATQGLYTPGSVFKTVVASAAIESGLAEPESVYRDEGALTVDSRIIIEENRPDPNKVNWTLTESYGFSLNVVFAQIGLQLGERLLEFAHRFGFGEEIPFEIPALASQVSSDPAFLTSRPGLATTAFGQGELAVTPLQVAIVAAAVANGGILPSPHLLGSVTDDTGETLVSTGTQTWKRAISEETASAMRQLMIASVENGYAADAHIPGKVVGGKTGTAEVAGGEPHAWFQGFIDDESTSYVVSVIVENGGPGGQVALPIGRELLGAATELEVTGTRP